MKIRYLAYIALVVTMAIWADSAWSAPAPRKAVTHAYVVRTGDGGWWRIAHTSTASRWRSCLQPTMPRRPRR